MEIIQRITLDFARSTMPVMVFAKQFDKDTRKIEITPMNNGEPYILDSGITAKLQMTKSDGKTVIDNANISLDKITVILTEQALAAAGTAVAEIGLYKDDKLLSSQTFYIDIQKGAYELDAVVSSDEFTGLADEMAAAAKKAVEAILATKEDTENKTTDLNEESTNLEYPTAKAVYDALADKADAADLPALIDSTLAVSGKAADAKAVGDVLNGKADAADLPALIDKTLSESGKAADAKAVGDVLNGKADAADLPALIDKTLSESGKAADAEKVGAALFRSKDRAKNIPAAFTCWNTNSYSSSSPASPSDMPVNSWCYANGTIMSGFNNTVFTLAPSSYYWFICLGNTISATTEPATRQYFIWSTGGTEYYHGRSTDGGSTVSWKDRKYISLDDTLSESGKAADAEKVGAALFRSKDRTKNIPAAFTCWNINSYSSSSPASPSDMPVNSWCYANGAIMSGFNNTVFTLAPSSYYWFICLGNTISATTEPATRQYFIWSTGGTEYYHGRSTDGGSTVSWKDRKYISLDDTLSESGKAADAKAVGDALNGSGYTGAKVSILGASISTFDGYIPDGYSAHYPATSEPAVSRPDRVQDVTDTYWYKFISEIGGELLVDNASAGSYCSTRIGSTSMAGCGPRCEALDNGTDMPDIIIIQLGGNDFTRSVPLGTYDGTQELPTDTTTFREAYAVMLNKITTKYKNAKVICGTIPIISGGSYVTRTFPAKNLYQSEDRLGGILLEEYNRAIRELAALFGCQVVEFSRCGLTYNNVDIYMEDYISVSKYGQHPNRLGHSLMANELLRTIGKTFIFKNIYDNVLTTITRDVEAALSEV